MKTLVVYYSKYGNTRRIAEAITETATRAGDARVISMDQLTASDFDGVDLVVIGSPTHIQNLPKAVRSVLQTLPSDALVGKHVAAFDTPLEMWGPLMRMTAAHSLARLLRKLGGKSVVKPEVFLVEGGDVQTEGEVDLLHEEEIEHARVWAGAILRESENQPA